VKHPADSRRPRLINPHFRPSVFTPADSCQAHSFEPAAPPARSKKTSKNPRTLHRAFPAPPLTTADGKAPNADGQRRVSAISSSENQSAIPNFLVSVSTCLPPLGGRKQLMKSSHQYATFGSLQALVLWHLKQCVGTRCRVGVRSRCAPRRLPMCPGLYPPIEGTQIDALRFLGAFESSRGNQATSPDAFRPTRDE
jgi:hypothetical protein